MSPFVPRFTISIKLYVLIGLIAVGIGGLWETSAALVHKALFEQHINQAREQVESIRSLISVMAEEARKKKLPQEQVQAKALSLIQNIRYGQNNYFWISTMKGFVLAHPDQRLLGKNTLSRRDTYNNLFAREFVDTVKKKGEGAVTYFWPPEDGKLKVSYVAGFPEWSWIIGTGVYAENIQTEIDAIESKLSLAAVCLLFITFILAFWIGRSISKPLLELASILQKVAAQDLDVNVAISKRTDEIGIMARTIGVFVENARGVAAIEAEKKRIEKTKGDFVSIVSHELRTPLTAIKGAISLVLGTMIKEIPEKAIELLKTAQENCERVVTIVNDLLDIDKMESGQLSLTLKEENLSSLLKETVKANEPYARKCKVGLILDEPPGRTRIRTDKTRLIQVLSNLISNAAKFSPSGDVVRLSVERRFEKVRVNVTDHGFGIPEEFRSRLFQKFSQGETDQPEKARGSGLGLSICKSLVERMGGEIGFETKTGFGTTFWIEFPVMGEKDV